MKTSEEIIQRSDQIIDRMQANINDIIKILKKNGNTKETKSST